MGNFHLFFACSVSFQIVGLTIAQQVAPGISPDVYKQYDQAGNLQYQPQGNAQYQQQQYRQQQVPQNVQYQQGPTPPHVLQQHENVQYAPGSSNVQYQQPIQQQATVGQQTPHGHGHGHGQQPLGGNMKEEREHIAEHMDVPIDTSNMSDQELQFHYFKMHDNDRNNKLDGCELIKSLIHWHVEQGSKENHSNPQQPKVEDKVFTDEELISLIDPILKMDDTSNDGYIDYPEFIRAQQKAGANQQQPQH